VKSGARDPHPDSRVKSRVVYFDCPSGAAGDMIMGALVDAGAPAEALRAELAKLRLPGWELAVQGTRRGAFRATKVDVLIDASAHRHHRSLPEIISILGASDLAPAITEAATRIFTRLAEAEARVHGTTPDLVQFHDVGAVDAIVDITGAVVALELLGAQAVHMSALPIGGGFVGGPHGKMPVPAPGTAELLKGFPVVDPGIKAELVTPTGAAILTTLAASAGFMPPMTVTAVGYGAGTMELPIPNVVRCFVGELAVTPAAGPGALEIVVQLETTIDDMSPQLYEPLMERLFEAGALDVFLSPVIMKRGRPGVVVTALCPPAMVSALSRTLFEESSTIGIRWSEVRRAVLDRELRALPTAHGSISFKISRLEGRVVTVTPEFADVARIAREKGLPVREVLDQARADGRRSLS
jgi:pyridinium-3,5-bisthiocarboxylic acid mononucleotide nickel chelatase